MITSFAKQTSRNSMDELADQELSHVDRRRYHEESQQPKPVGESFARAEPLRVLHVSSGNLFGGVEAILAMLARYDSLGAEMKPHFALCFEQRLSRELNTIGVPVYQLGEVRASRPWTVRRARREFAELLRRENFDLVVCHSAWPHAIFGAVARAANKPVVFWLHNQVAGRHWTERWARLTRPNLVLCVSKSTAETAGNVFPRVRSEVFHSPLLLPEVNYTKRDRAQVRAELTTPEDATVIIQVSRLEPWKGHLLHFEALSRLREVPGWICWQVGGVQRPQEAIYLEELKSAAQRLGISDRVRFLGQRADVPRLLAAADIFCQPNTATEGFSISFMEAFLAGLPIVTTALGGALEIVDDSCGAPVPAGDMSALTAALRRLIHDPALRLRLGATGRQRVWELCEPAMQMKKLHKIFADVVSESVPA
jgi:glycosyltransferase involved in cell wall biosynthesis